MRLCAAISLTLCLASPPVAQAIIIQGLGEESANSLPFGSGVFDEFEATRYQQVYSAGAFPGPINIAAIGFFHDNSIGGNFISGLFTFELSVTSKPVDGLNVVDFDDNVTGPVHSFAVKSFTGAAATSFQVAGTPFLYDPADGNLLLDIKVPGGAMDGDTVAFFDSWNGDAGGVFSRATNFGTGFVGRGLETEFVPVPEPSTLLLAVCLLLGLAVARARGSALCVAASVSAECVRAVASWS